MARRSSWRSRARSLGLETALGVVGPKGRIALVGSQQRLDRLDLFWPLQHSGARIVPLYREGAASPQAGGAGQSVAAMGAGGGRELLLRAAGSGS